MKAFRPQSSPVDPVGDAPAHTNDFMFFHRPMTHANDSQELNVGLSSSHTKLTLLCT